MELTLERGHVNEWSFSGLYKMLKPQVRHWVRSSRVPSWVGQEEDVVDDIIQESMQRIWNYVSRAEQGSVHPLTAPDSFYRTIAHNYYLDLRRKDKRLLHSSRMSECLMRSEGIEIAELALEHTLSEELFLQIAKTVAAFPQQQRQALLRDLAKHMYFSEPPTPLQRSFRLVGIHLEQYAGPLPKDPQSKNRFASALSTAYKRLKKELAPRDSRNKNNGYPRKNASISNNIDTHASI